MNRGAFLAISLVVATAACGGRSGLLSRDGQSPRGDGPRADRSRPDRDTPRPGWVALPLGSFLMGSPPGEPCREQGNVKETQHSVTLTHGFEMEETEVTQEAYVQATGNSPSKFAVCGPRCPVEQVSWHEAAAYCNILSSRSGLSPCYQCSGSDPVCSPAPAYQQGNTIYGCPGYRLPTEAEWEFAYRAGTTTALYNGPVASCETDKNASAIGWYSANAGGTTHPVRQKLPNAWGLYDLPGNVWEWCHDGYLQNLGSVAIQDPVSSLVSTSSRAIRGSSYNDDAGNMRAADRFGMPPEIRNINVGFRCVRSLLP